MTKRWVRFVMPIMVELDGDEDDLLRVVTLPEEIRQDRDDRGHFLIYDERFVRRHGDDQPQTHASCVAEPYWEHERFRVGPPVNWPEPLSWEEGFDLPEACLLYTSPSPRDS